MQQYLTRDFDAGASRPWVIRMIYANWFYLSIAAMLGGLAGWAIMEPFYDDNAPDDETNLMALLVFPTVAAGVGLFLGAAEGIMCRNYVRALTNGIVGLGVGFLGGFVALVPTIMIFSLMSELARSLWQNPVAGEMPTGLALIVFMMGRAAAWAVAAIPSGLGQGIALREKKVVINGLVGGLLGGLVGGLLFDPIYMLFTADDGQATYSRAVGFGTIGLFVGLFVGLVEGWTIVEHIAVLHDDVRKLLCECAGVVVPGALRVADHEHHDRLRIAVLRGDDGLVPLLDGAGEAVIVSWRNHGDHQESVVAQETVVAPARTVHRRIDCGCERCTDLVRAAGADLGDTGEGLAQIALALRQVAMTPIDLARHV